MKLTKPQAELLQEIIDNPRSVADYYPSAKFLVRNGLAKWTGKWGQTLTPTEAGEEFNRIARIQSTRPACSGNLTNPPAGQEPGK